MTSLRVSVGGLVLENPTMLASGVLGETGGSILEVARAGAGAVVTKSIGLVPKDGYSNPTMVELPYGYLNAMGLPNPGIDGFRAEMIEAVRGGVPVVGSIFASNEVDFAGLARKMEEFGASAVELNLSCPHAKGYGMEVGVDPETVGKIVQAAKRRVRIPVFAKLTPNAERLVEVGKAVEEAGGDAVVAINTVKAMAISTEFRKPILSNRIGGLSGQAIKPIGVRCVFELYEALRIPIIGAGGIGNWRDAVEYMLAGASAVQIGSGVARKGLGVFRSVCDGLERYLARNGFSDIREVVGAAHDRT
ncbi:MAG: dihydroorotate dehydrogenase [Euryarchaeota archaeon]|nr:dihydroorotate dehydrogenase [Euryarchaeota archaeon]